VLKILILGTEFFRSNLSMSEKEKRVNIEHLLEYRDPWMCYNFLNAIGSYISVQMLKKVVEGYSGWLYMCLCV